MIESGSRFGGEMKGKRQMEEAIPRHLVHNMPTYPVISKSQHLCVLVFSPVLYRFGLQSILISQSHPAEKVRQEWK